MNYLSSLMLLRVSSSSLNQSTSRHVIHLAPSCIHSSPSVRSSCKLHHQVTLLVSAHSSAVIQRRSSLSSRRTLLLPRSSIRLACNAKHQNQTDRTRKVHRSMYLPFPLPDQFCWSSPSSSSTSSLMPCARQSRSTNNSVLACARFTVF